MQNRVEKTSGSRGRGAKHQVTGSGNTGWRTPALVAAILAFIGLTVLVMTGQTAGIDSRILLAFRQAADLSDPVGPEWLEVVMRDMTALGGAVVLSMLVIFVSGYLFLRGYRLLAVCVALSIAVGTMLNALLKGLIERARPDLVPHATDAALSSFPSGHTMMSTMTYLTLGALLSLASDDPRIKRYYLLWSILPAVMVGISRLYLGVHWPTDILAGWIAGFIWATLSMVLVRRFLASRTGIAPGSIRQSPAG